MARNTGGDMRGGAGASKTAAPSKAAAAHDPSGPGLVICRNKHWRYISSFHGPWLQLPPEILDSLAHQNYFMPPPRLVDPAVFYDVVKIRRAVDDAAHDSVRASTGINTPPSAGGRADYLPTPAGPGGQLSKERIFKIRQKAVRLLATAYRLDEVAASVATMQATSTIDDVAAHVLKREPSNTDARYTHFFHEKIPSRAMTQYTPLEPLDDIIRALPLERQAGPLRTRALVQIFKHQWEDAALDLTAALHIEQELKSAHRPGQQELELASRMRQEQEAWQKSSRDGRSVPQVKEEDQPKSMEMQLLFNRGGVYLTIACEGIHAALDGLKDYQSGQEKGEATVGGDKAQAARLEARKKVKTHAKRALKDYSAFLSNLDYTPGLPTEMTNEIMRRVYDLANGTKTQARLPKHRLIELSSDDEGTSDSTEANGDSVSTALIQKSRAKAEPFERGEDGWPRFPSPKIYPASALFAEKPPSDLPLFPSDETAAAMLNNEPLSGAFGSREAVTYHPLLTDVLHSLLLCHALLQTSPTELLRHAHNAARLARIADGYPIFQAARSPARADWIEVLRRANNWLGLEVPWQRLCAPAPLPEAAESTKPGSNGDSAGNCNGSGASDALARQAASERSLKLDESAEQRRERIKQESIIDALSDDRVVDEDSFQRAVRARERRALEDEQGLSGPLHDRTQQSEQQQQADDMSPSSCRRASASVADGAPKPQADSSGPAVNGNGPRAPQRWAQDEHGKEYPISTERASAIARWIKDSPLSLGGKRKRPARRKKASPEGAGLDAPTDSLARLDVDERVDGPD